MSEIVRRTESVWNPVLAAAESQALAAELESGKVLFFPSLPFELEHDERRFLDARWSDGQAKNISYTPATRGLKGAAGSADELAALAAMIARYHAQALQLVQALLPGYARALRIAPTSFRPFPVEGRVSSWRKDDSRLHVDAFPSRPNHGERILRVFTNVNPDGIDRVWRVGEPFTALAARYLPSLPKPLPGSAALLRGLRITKSRRTAYDHYMLQLHDRMKADAAYQQDAPQERMPFPPGATWICFSDQTSHAAMSGQFLFEQTLHLPVAALYDPERAPLRVLERLAGRALI